MAPIRVGFLGLSKSGWAPGAHLPYLKASDKYEIVAICNSSVESSKAAIKTYDLPASTKAYSDPQDLADDKDIDLVVCSVRVDRHVKTIAPALKAGKDVFVEWPLGASLKEAEELLQLKNEGKVKNAIVGLQAREAPIVKKVTELVNSGKIGRVLSSVWTAQAGMGGKTVGESIAYILRREVGGNLVTIHFGHSVDYVQQVLGYGFKTEKSLLVRRRDEAEMTNAEGKVIDEHFKITAEDVINFNGVLSSSGVVLSMSLRDGKPFKGTPGLDWRITGDKGEIRVTAGGPFLQIGYPDQKIELCDFEKDTVETVQAQKDEFDELGIPARNVARVYNSLQKGEYKYLVTFEDAVERHKLIDRLYSENGYQGYH